MTQYQSSSAFSGGGGGGSSVVTTEGDIIVGNGSGEEARLPIGTSGKVLESDGTTASWQTPSAGGAPFNLDDTGSGSMTVEEEQNASFAGDNDTFYGVEAGANVTTGARNTLVGHNADVGAATNGDAVAVGYDAEAGASCVSIGSQSEGSGSQCIAIGYQSKASGASCVVIGTQAGATDADNVVIGTGAGRVSGFGDGNVAVGRSSGANAQGDDNVWVGHSVGAAATGSRNTILGHKAGAAMTTGDDNVWIGNQCGQGLGGASDRLIIENSSDTTTPLIDGVFKTGAAPTLKFNADNVTAVGQIGSEINDIGASGTTKTIDWDDGNVQFLDMTGNVTLTLSNPISGFAYTLVVKQGAGSQTITWPAAVKWSGGTAPTLSTGASDIDVITLVYNGLDSEYYGAANLDFS